MSDEITVTVEGEENAESENSTAAEDHAAETVIDAAIVAGTDANRADESAADAQVSAIDAEHAADQANAVVEVQQQQINDLAGIASSLQTTAETLAASAAIVAQQQSDALQQQQLSEPTEVTITEEAPQNNHFLSRKWFSRG